MGIEFRCPASWVVTIKNAPLKEAFYRPTGIKKNETPLFWGGTYPWLSNYRSSFKSSSPAI